MVEWKKLGEISSLVRGKVISKDFIRDHKGFFPVYSSQTANNGILGYIDSYMFDGNYLTWTTDGAYAGTVFRRSGRFNITNVCGLIKLINEKVNQDFLFYWLSYTAKDYVIEGMGNPKLMSNVASTILIPIPSLAKQERIVGILDTFTASIDNLKAQIAQRRKQLEFYRNQLLDLEGKSGVEINKLGETCCLERGVRVVKKNLQGEGVIPVYQNSLTPLGFYDKSNYPEDTTFVICAGAAGEVGYSKNAFWAADDCTCIVCSPSVCSKYVYNYLITKQHLIKSQVRKASVPRLSKDVIGKLSIPIPSLSEQHRIVSILDTFEASITNLEAQLAERQKQYEYYRNKLLTFE